MDTLIISQKLESLRRCLRRVEEKCPVTADTLTHDPDLQDIIVLNLTRSIQLCVDIASHILSQTGAPAPSTMGEAFTALETLGILSGSSALQLRKAVGFRNIAVHNYEAINWQIVHAICTRQLPDFKQFAASVVDYCQL